MKLKATIVAPEDQAAYDHPFIQVDFWSDTIHVTAVGPEDSPKGVRDAAQALLSVATAMLDTLPVQAEPASEPVTTEQALGLAGVSLGQRSLFNPRTPDGKSL